VHRVDEFELERKTSFALVVILRGFRHFC